MATDWLPKSAANLRDWSQNLVTELPDAATTLGMAAADKTALLALATPLKDAAQAVLDAQAALDAASGALRTFLADNTAELRRSAAAIKQMAKYDDGIGSTLQITGGPSAPFDAAGYKPTISVEAFPGYVRVSGTKRGIASMNIYARLKGQPEWKLLAARRSKFPFDDDSPLAQPGVPETREYRAIGVVDDEETGQPSDIASVTYGG